MKHSRILLAAALIGLATGAQAHTGSHENKPAAAVKKEQKDWGIAGDTRAAGRTVDIAMGDDMRFKPGRIEVREGETLRLRVKNAGKLMHELVIGTRQVLDEHAALMQKFPAMEHDEPYMTHVAPGQTGELVWTFNRAGVFDFACLIAGHYQAGMVGKLIVQPKR